MENLLQDLRYGFRMLVKSPAFTAVAVLSLALGIGANTTIFTLINAVLLNPVPVQDPSSLVWVYTTDEKNRTGFNEFMPMSYPNYEDYRDHNGSFAATAAFTNSSLNMTGGGEPEQIQGEIVSGNFFPLLGVKPALGRAFLPEEDKTPGAYPVAILSDGFWKRRFASDPGIIGKPLTLNGHGYTVVGVAPPAFRGVNAFFAPDVWVPMMMHQQVLTGFFAENFNDRRALLFNVLARLKSGTGIEQATADLKTIASRLEREYPEPNRGRSVTMLPLAQSTINPAIRRVFVLAGGLLMTVVGLVLLIACANVANLLLARATTRRKEIAIRLSLGAGRARLIRQLMTESILLSLLGGAVGLLFAVWGRDLLLAFRPPQFLPVFADLDLDGRVLGFTLLVSLLTGVLFGLAPALQASRPGLVTELKEGASEAGGGRRRLGLRGALVVAQVALSLISLVGAGLFVRSLRNTERVNPGFEASNLLVVSFDLGAQGYDETRGREFHRRALERIATLPGVLSATLATNLPIAGGGIGRTVFPEGHEPTAGSTGQFVTTNTVAVGYFATLGVPIRRGRDLAETDKEDMPRAVVINQAMAQRFWPGEEAVGKRFKFFGDTTFAEVVGVAENTKIFTLAEDPQPVAYIPLLQAYEPFMTLHVRTAGDPAALVETVRREVRALAPDLPLTNVQTVTQLIDQSLWAPRMAAGLLIVFGLLALVLAGVGIYGVMAYSVAQRTHEIGIRMALGAQQRDVLRLVLSQGMVLVAAGLALGVVASFALSRVISTLLFGVSPTDLITFTITPAILALVAVLASYIPARRATKVDPLLALRYE
jgi:predicted permease